MFFLCASAGCEDDEIAKISHENNLRWLRFDLFKYFKPSESTVGALLARTLDVDKRTRSKAEYANA